MTAASKTIAQRKEICVMELTSADRTCRDPSNEVLVETDRETGMFHFPLLKEIEISAKEMCTNSHCQQRQINTLFGWRSRSITPVEACSYSTYYATFPKLWLCFGLESIQLQMELQTII